MENNLDSSSEEQAKAAIIANSEVNYFGLANYRNQNRKFGIKLDDRRRHMYVVGKTGMGKTTLLENMVLNDIYAGHGLGYVDPHGDTAEKILDYIPANRINDVVYFNPADLDYPIGFNILETVRPEYKHLVASGLMGVFKKIWPDVWSSRMEYILNNTILALLDFPGTTLLGINRMLADAVYRKRIVHNVKDPVVKAFWLNEFASYNDRYQQEAVAPIQNKIGQFLSASVIRNIVAQVKSRIDIREIMDNKKIFIMNLSKGRIGEDNSRLLGGMLITKLQLSAMERVDTPEEQRPDFFLYVDEFQNFATESFAGILSEARKYHLSLIMAHQYMEQLDEAVLAAVIGNVGTTVTFRVGSTDAEILAKEFVPTFIEEDLVNLPKYHIYLKLMIDGIASKPFSALTLPPIAQTTHSQEKVVRVSRERYAVPKDKIEDKIARWSGMVIMNDDDASELEVDDDEAMFEKAPVPIKSPSISPPFQGGGEGVVSVKHAFVIPTPKEESLSRAPTSPVIPTKVGISGSTIIPIPTKSVSNSLPRPIAQPQFGTQPPKKKRHRNRHKNDQASNSFGSPTPIILTDPNEKGMSLSSLQPKSNSVGPGSRGVARRSLGVPSEQSEPRNMSITRPTQPRTILPNRVENIDE